MAVLAGVTDTSSFTSTAQLLGSSDEWVSRGSDTTGTVLSYTAVAGTAETVGIYIDSINVSGNGKLLVTDTSGNILGTTASTANSGWSSGWNDISLVSTFEVSADDELVPWIAVDSGSVRLLTTTQLFWTNQHNLGTYASPNDPLTIDDGGYATREFAMRISGTLGASGPTITLPTGPWYGADGKQIKQHPG